MVVRVAQRAQLSQAATVVVATDSQEVAVQCAKFGIQSVMTASAHASGSDRLAEACCLLGLSDDAVVVNVQGDEPLIDVKLIDDVAQLLDSRPDCAMSTAAHAINNLADYLNPNIVKVVLDARQNALYFSRAPLPAARGHPTGDWWTETSLGDLVKPMRHIGIYGYRAGFLKAFPAMTPAPVEQLECLEQLRAIWHGHRIAVHMSERPPGIGVDTPEDLIAARKHFS